MFRLTQCRMHGLCLMLLTGVAAGQATEIEVGRNSPFLCLTPQTTAVDIERQKAAEKIANSYCKHHANSYGWLKSFPSGPCTFAPLIAVKGDAWTHPNGDWASPGHPVTVNVAFLDGTRQQREWVKQYAAEWIKETQVPLVTNFNDERRTQIRVTFAKSENRSEIGNQAMEVKGPNKPTMYLGDVQPWRTPVRVRQVILHEFGHAFGLRHEHKHPQSGITWNEAEIEKDFPWLSREAIRSEITGTYSEDYLCRGAKNFDPTSIMMYPIPARWMVNHAAIVPGVSPSQFDRACLLSLYPAVASDTRQKVRHDRGDNAPDTF